MKNNPDFNYQNWFVAQWNISKANSALPQIPEWAFCGAMTNSAPDVSKSSQWHWCENRKWAAKCSHNNFLMLVQVFKLPHCCQSTLSHHLLLSQALQPFPWCTLNLKQKQKKREEKTGWNCSPLWESECYQPFLPAGRAPSPAGCESCLWCGPYVCAPVHCGVPVCLPAMRSHRAFSLAAVQRG